MLNCLTSPLTQRCPSVRLPVSPSVRLSVCPSVRLSVRKWFLDSTRTPPSIFSYMALNTLHFHKNLLWLFLDIFCGHFTAFTKRKFAVCTVLVQNWLAGRKKWTFGFMEIFNFFFSQFVLLGHLINNLSLFLTSDDWKCLKFCFKVGGAPCRARKRETLSPPWRPCRGLRDSNPFP